MIRVLHVVGRMILGGTQTMIMNIYRNIDRDEIQFDFVVDHSDQMHYEAEIEELGGKIYKMPRFKGYNVIEICNAWKAFFIQHPEYKILHSHIRSYASIFIPIAKQFGLKTIIHSHSTSNGRGIEAVIKNMLQYPIRYQADYFLGCSKEAGEWLFGKKVVESSKFHVLMNGIDIEKYKYNPVAKKELCEEFGLKDVFVFGHVGRFHESKNHMFLLELYKALRTDFQKSKLVIVGDGELRERIENKIKELELEGEVILTGTRKDVNAFYSLFDCLLFPSKWEGFGITVLEAQASGIPVFVSENIPIEAIATDLVKRNSLNIGCDIWSKEIVKEDMKRVDNSGVLVQKGFDIRTTARWISNFYMEVINGQICYTSG